jgi:hypothetical protein
MPIAMSIASEPPVACDWRPCSQLPTPLSRR